MPENTEETPVVPEGAQPNDENPQGPALMGLAAPSPSPSAIQTIAENVPEITATLPPVQSQSDILRAVNDAHAEAMEVLNRIWNHLANGV